MKKIVSILILLSFSPVLYAQVQEAWVAKTLYGSTTKFNYGNDVVLDAAGNVYVVGNVDDDDGLVDDDYAGGMVTIKYDKFGILVWKVRFVMVGLTGSDIEVDSDGNVYVVGYRTTSSAFDRVHSDFLTIKYNHLGEIQWSRPYSGPQKTANSAYLGLDAAGNVYIAGTSQGEEQEDPEDGDYAIIKYDNDGITKWERRYNGAAPNNRLDELKGMMVDPSGNVYVTGISQKDGIKSTTTIKYSTTGTELWVNRHNKTALSTDAGNDITYDQSGNVYVTGGFHSEIGYGFETIKYNSDGIQQWVAYYDNPEDYSGAAVSLVVDNAQNCYIVGYNKPGGNLPLTTPGSIKIIKYSNAGNQQWINNYDARFISGTSYSKVGTGQLEFEDHVARIVIGTDAGLYITTTSLGEDGSGFVTLKYGSATGSKLWEIKYNGSSRDISRALWLDASDNVYVTGESDGKFTTIKYSQCSIVCPSNIVVNSEPGKCGAIVNFNPATYTGDCGSTFTYSHNTGIEFPIGKTTVTVTSDATGASCSFDITVNDNELPVMTCPADKAINMANGVCYVSASTVNAVAPTATDNCSAIVTGVRSDGQLLTANYPGGITTITWTATDPSNNTATCTQKITVVDNQAPVISNASVSKGVLSPPNHKMVDITIDYTVTDNCAATSSISITSDEAQTGLSNGDVGPDIIKINEHLIQLRAERDGKGDGRVYTITITANDGQNITTKDLTVVVAHDIKSPVSGAAVKIGSTVNFSGDFWDVPGNKHTAKWLIDDKTIISGVVTEPSGMKNGTVTGSYKFTSPGVYKLQMNITDQKGVTTSTTTNGDLEAIVVVYDPNGGYTYGGGSFNSPKGALKSNVGVTGDVSYGFTVNYYKGAALPKGETQFDFKLADFEYNALNFDYLAISGAKAQLKGTGKIIGGQSGINFIMTVIDGQIDGTGVDKIRMKIYNKNTGQIYYDNQPGASDAANPITVVGTNSTVVIQGGPAAQRISTSNIVKSTDLEVVVSPNPSKENFSVLIKSDDVNTLMTLQVFDQLGRLVDSKQTGTDATIKIGQSYRAGIYYIRVVQGKRHREVKLIKLTN